MAEKLKDILFTENKVRYFAQVIKEEYQEFDANAFVEKVCDQNWPERELKEKMRHTTLCLKKFLPADFEKSVEVLKAIVPKVKGFEAIVLPDFVEVYGRRSREISLPALKELTKPGSAEFAIRAFLIDDLEHTMNFLQSCAIDEDYRVRRFASEGCRPRLPWAMGVPELKKDPRLILPILEILKNDPEEFVRKSVANNLNDISKDHPKLVLDICERWHGNSKKTNWIIKHACRTLLKQGNKRAMLLFGFANPELMQVENFIFSDESPKIGDEISFEFNLVLKTKKKQKVRIEYKVYFVKSTGKTSPKVFQIKEVEMLPGVHNIIKKHSFKNLTTRKHFTGTHQFEVVINGEVKTSKMIELRNA